MDYVYVTENSLRSGRKKRTPLRLDGISQERLSWIAKHVVPPSEEGEASPFEGRLRQTAARSKKRKSVKSIILSRISKEYEFSLRLLPNDPSQSALFRLGEVVINGEDLDAPGLTDGAYLAFKRSGEAHLFWEKPTATESFGFRKVSVNLPPNVLHVFKLRGKFWKQYIFAIQSCSISSVCVDILAPEKHLSLVQDRYEANSKNADKGIQILMNFFFGVEHTEFPEILETNRDYDSLFQKVLDAQRKEGILPVNTPIDCPLKVTLREYQREAVAWMVQMETQNLSPELVEMWQTIEDARGRTVYYNRISGCLARDVLLRHVKLPRFPGGILADEMGLGKTLEVIACLLSHPRPGYQSTSNDEENEIVIVEDSKKETPYICEICSSTTIAGCPENVSRKCPACWAASDTLFPLKTTLIVCPTTICEQWTDEINWLVGECSLRVFVYRGVSFHGYVPPERLNTFDLVLTTYEILRKEIYHANAAFTPASEQRKFRAPKRHKVCPSPLVSVEFWRVALDEAQMVEQCTVIAAQMVLQIPAVHRWCVTGTPIHRDLSDIFGLFVFLRFEPYDQELWFKQLLEYPFLSGDSRPLVEVLSKCFRRMGKKEVFSQLGIPPQHTHVHKLTLSPVEDVFYGTQAKECAQMAFKVASKFPQDAVISKLLRSNVVQLVAPLKKLRQACSHPQAVRGAMIGMKTTLFTMDDLLKALIKNSVKEAEEAHRRVISSLNGLAGLALLRRDVIGSADFYRQVLWSISYHQGNVRADPLQQYHTYVNLSKLLEENSKQLEQSMRPVMDPDRWNPQGVSVGPNGTFAVPNLSSQYSYRDRIPSIPRAAGDDMLLEKAYQVKEKYLKKFTDLQKGALLELREKGQKLEEINRQLSRSEKWYLTVLTEAEIKGDGHRIAKKIKEYLIENKTVYGVSLISRFNDTTGLKFLIQSQLDALRTSRESLLKVIEQFAADPTKEDVQSAISCHLRPVKKKRPKCRYCLVQEILVAYETKLFSCDPQQSEADEEREGKEEEENEEIASAEDLARGDGIQRKGTWQLSDIEKIIICLANTSKLYTDDPTVLADAALHCDLLSSMRTEFKSFSVCYRQTKDYVAALDELEMATIKFERAPDIVGGFQKAQKPANALYFWEIDAQVDRLNIDKASGEADLRKRLGQVYYLKNLEKSNQLTGDTNEEECPTCRNVLGKRWSVMHCGHNVCIECIHILVKSHCPVGLKADSTISIPCPMCREASTQDEIYSVDLSKRQELRKLNVVGNHSSKITGIIDTLLEIRNDDPNTKTLVFSIWPAVLTVLQRALNQNGISNILLTGSTFQKSLKVFKRNPMISVLLMPLHLGSKGLNLTEASNVILVEPLLDTGDEVQALGRIHRIGQTKETHVHRFMIENSIEERISKLVESKQQLKDVDDEGLTVGELRELFCSELANLT